ncbi:hypothetical protein [Scytonema sp. HK-05]|uniref:hypothetical protein n=1 Tax=Scytonema sp. HK-05 TaxID=1137095 RepID=UPI00130132E0|nr:hypothetical protein [Scytonema sp. HK-05]
MHRKHEISLLHFPSSPSRLEIRRCDKKSYHPKLIFHESSQTTVRICCNFCPSAHAIAQLTETLVSFWENPGKHQHGGITEYLYQVAPSQEYFSASSCCLGGWFPKKHLNYKELI